jgi:hypothetical protein
MRGRPPYYKEAEALFWCLEKSKIYADGSPYPVHVKTDHMPLLWVNHSDKGAITAWRMEMVNGIDWTAEHVAGKDNIIPDAFSRFPFLGKRQLARVGLLHAVEILLDKLPENIRQATKVWSWAGSDTQQISRRIQQWRPHRNPILQSATQTARGLNWELGLVVPRAGKSPKVAAELLKQNKPVCLLMPTELVCRISQKMDSSQDLELQAKVDKCRKIVLLQPSLVWLLHNVEVEQDEVFSNELVTMPPETVEEWKNQVGTLQEWIQEQPASQKTEEGLKEMKESLILTRPSGLILIEKPHDTAKVYVPLQRRTALIDLVHHELQHLGADKCSRQIRRNYYWPKMQQQIKLRINECLHCNLANAKRNLSHGKFRALTSTAIRSKWQMDFYGVANGAILGLIDTASRYVILEFLPDRSAEGVAEVISRRIISEEGIPDNIHSDDAKEFTGEVMKSLAKIFNIDLTNTLGYNPMGNSTIESFFEFLGRCLKRLTDEQYQKVKYHLPKIASAWNNTHKESIGCAPNELMKGTTIRKLYDTIPLTEPAPATDKQSVKQTIVAYAQLAALHDQYWKEATAKRLNDRKYEKTYKVGDKVAIYKPPSHEAVKKHGRKAKHLYQWIGPCTVAHKPSVNTYEVVHDHTSRKYQRSIINVRKWKTQKETPVTNVTDAESIKAGMVIAAIDIEYTDHVILGYVLEIMNDMVVIQILTTTTQNLTNAVFQKTWNDTRKKQLQRFPPVHNQQHIQKFTAEYDYEDQNILMTDIKFTDTNKLIAADRRKLTNILRQRKLQLYSL